MFYANFQNQVEFIEQSYIVFLMLLTQLNAISLVNKSSFTPKQCYQCISSSYDRLPICDYLFWKVTTKKERYLMQVQCPVKKSNFCLKKIVWKENVAMTSRGCAGPTDERGVKQTEGCLHMEKQKIVICLCKNELCNFSNVKTKPVIYVLGLISIIFLM